MQICVFGDSHSRIFNHCITDHIKFDVIFVSGATAQGCVNPNSKTDALRIYESHIMKSKKYDKIMIMLGEVDCGYLVWVRSKRYNISIESQIDLCIKNINEFIVNILIKNGYTSDQVILCGAHLPIILDNTDPKYLCGARKEVDISQYERTLKTLEYNKRLESMAKINGYKYIDITKYILGDDGLVKKYYLNDIPGDNHLDNSKIVDFWKNEVISIVHGN
jgi:hypothetical protein